MGQNDARYNGKYPMMRVPTETADALRALSAETNVPICDLIGQLVGYAMQHVKKRPKAVIYEIYFNEGREGLS